MKINFNIKKKLKLFLLFIIPLFIFFTQSNYQIVKAFPMDNYQNQIVVEELRLKVPAEFKEVWLNAEKNIWEPWLSVQDGFLRRQIFWDKEKEEALILVDWENEKLWKNISIKEVNQIQEEFEKNVKTALGNNTNPFKLINEGELYKQE